MAEYQQRTRPPPAPTPPPTNSQRLLPGGFLNGGTVRNDAQAEVLRLSATIEALNSKYSAQSERLARTEASLVRANRAVTSERATSNARLLKLQNELKEMKHKEAKLQETALARRELSKTDVAFSESAKRAEAMDAELCELRERAAALATARTELLAKVSELSTSLESATQRTATMDAELAAKSSELLKYQETDAAAALEAMQLNESKRELESKLGLKEDELAATTIQLEELTKRYETEIQTLTDRLNTPPAPPAASTASAPPAAFTASSPPAPPIPSILPAAPEPISNPSTASLPTFSYSTDFEDEFDEPQAVIFHASPRATASSRASLAAHLQHRTATFPVPHRQTQRHRVGLVLTGAANEVPPDVAALITAVSKDITAACIDARRQILTREGRDAAEIEAELANYS